MKTKFQKLVKSKLLIFISIALFATIINCSEESDNNNAYCGDGTLDSGESCDDGNTTDGDGCQANCALPTCGDGIVDSGEACDAGASNSDGAADACRTTCVLAYCGDGIVDTGEACDDGNALDDGNGCASNCSANATASASAYTAAPNWNDYVRASDGVTACDGTETGGYDQCIHGGENRVLTLDGQSSCEGITATDVLGAFNWLCRVNAGQAEVYSASLADGKYLSDLIDWSASPPVWRPNSITVTMTGGSLTTASSVWYGNTIVENTTGGSLTDIDADGVGEIYAVTTNPAMPITIDANKLALVIKPGVTMTGSATANEILVKAASANNNLFNWIEGVFDATGDDGGIVLENTSFVVVRGVTANNATVLSTVGCGVAIDGSAGGGSNRLIDITASNNISTGVAIFFSSSNKLENIVAKDNADHGLLLYSTSNNMVEGVMTSGKTNTTSGMTGETNSAAVDITWDMLTNGDNNKLKNIVSTNNAGVGIKASTANNTFTDVVASDNGGTGIYVATGTGNRFYDVVASNNSNNIYFTSKNNILTNAVIDGGAIYGLGFGASNNHVSNLTIVNNADSGIGVEATSQYIGNALVSNAQGIAAVDAWNGNVQYANLVVGESGSNVLTVDGTATGNYFTGLLKVQTASCVGGTGTGINADCTPEGISDHTLSGAISTANTFVGLVSTDDTANPNDTTGVAPYDSITDWANFDNPFRTWGKAATANPFPSVDYRGKCTTGTDCQIWDWRLKAGDTGDGGGAVALGVLALHNNGNAADTITHSWSGAAASQADCDTLQAGSVFVTDHCESTFLRNATEIMNDGLGNDNGLCESNETCMYTPNIGAYQGHGNIISAGTFTDGDTLTGIILMKYEENGI